MVGLGIWIRDTQKKTLCVENFHSLIFSLHCSFREIILPFKFVDYAVIYGGNPATYDMFELVCDLIESESRICHWLSFSHIRPVALRPPVGADGLYDDGGGVKQP